MLYLVIGSCVLNLYHESYGSFFVLDCQSVFCTVYVVKSVLEYVSLCLPVFDFVCTVS
ncbi:hypothetical protein Hanom_Chr08g00744591 [Helianthus anomalus]